jgi:hypothetical protein
MKKIIAGAIVGGIIIFIWQTLSWTVLNIHYKAEQYTPKQDSILQFLSTQDLKTGQYLMPGLPPGSTMDDMNKLGAKAEGKPWAVISYHQRHEMNMGMNMLSVFAVNILIVALLCWILLKMNAPGFGTIFLSSLFVGLIVFLNSPYTYHIWYQSPNMKGELIDAVVNWGAVGLWLGWWLRKK